MPDKGPVRPTSESADKVLEGNDALPRIATPSDVEIAEQSLDLLKKLGRTIEQDVIPRLMLALKPQRRDDSADHAHAVQLSAEVDDFVHIVLNHDTPQAIKYLSTIRANGIPLASIYLDLLAPAARRIGELWENDEASFADVTIGVCRMHQVLLEFSRCFDAPAESSDRSRNILLLPAPGEQHTFGLLMVIEFLRREAWNCYSGSPPDLRDSKKIINAQHYRVIGLSVSADRHVDGAASLIQWIRNKSRNRDALIILGGRSVIADPDIVSRTGADAYATDGAQAVRRIDRLTRSGQGLTGVR